jgi:hypothetical protein
MKSESEISTVTEMIIRGIFVNDDIHFRKRYAVILTNICCALDILCNIHTLFTLAQHSFA